MEITIVDLLKVYWASMNLIILYELGIKKKNYLEIRWIA